MAAPATFEQSSRKGKSAWRKNIDLTSVESGLEVARQELIDNGALLTELDAQSLFTTDIIGSESIQKKYEKKHKPLKADQILAERSKVPALKGLKRAAEEEREKSKRKRLNSLTPKQYAKLRNIAYGGQNVHKDVVKGEGDASYDPWGDVVQPPIIPEELDYLENPQPLRIPKTIKEPSVSLAANGKKVRAVRRPAGNKSYNPVADEWMAEYEKEGEREVRAEQGRLDATEKEREKQAKIEAAWNEEDNEEKDWQSDWDSEWEGIASGNEEPPEWALKKRPERKTKQQRKKIERRKAEERLKKHEIQEKLKKQQAEKIKALAKEVEEKAQLKEANSKQTDNAEDSSEDDDHVQIRRIQPLSKIPLPEAPLELMLLEDLPDSLRKLKPEGNLLIDRYRSLLLQGKIESRKVVPSKKKAPKFTEKWSYKDWKLQ